MKSVSGVLANGLRYRVSSFVFTVHTCAGEVLQQFDLRNVFAIGRSQTTIRVRERNGVTVELTAETLEDADRIEALIRTSLNVRGVRPVPLLMEPAHSTASHDVPWRVLATIMAIGVLCFIGFNIAVPMRASEPTVVPIQRRVVYMVDDSAAASVEITYHTASGVPKSIPKANPIWRKRLAVAQDATLFVSARRGSVPGTIRCEIRDGGIVLESAEATGEFAVATCRFSTAGYLEPPSSNP
jgi:hypothetical protein